MGPQRYGRQEFGSQGDRWTVVSDTRRILEEVIGFDDSKLCAGSGPLAIDALANDLAALSAELCAALKVIGSSRTGN